MTQSFAPLAALLSVAAAPGSAEENTHFPYDNLRQLVHFNLAHTKLMELLSLVNAACFVLKLRRELVGQVATSIDATAFLATFGCSQQQPHGHHDKHHPAHNLHGCAHAHGGRP